jgi:hypothetical protein
MAVVIASVMLAVTIFTIPVKAAEPTTYIQSGTIWSESAGEYQMLDDAGELWGFTAGVYDYVVGQYVEMTMSDAGTQDNIFDDEVIAVNPIASPYDDVIVGPFGYYVLGAIAMKTYPDQSTVWFVDEFEDDWFFNGFCPVNPGDRVTLIINSNGTPNDFSDDYIEDVLFSDCDVD